MSVGSLIGLNARRTFAFFLDLFYPPRCGGCGGFGQGWWCAACHSSTNWFSGSNATKVLTLESGSTLTVVSAAPFAAPLREGIHRFKYEGQPQLAVDFAASMTGVWRGCNLSADLFVPVPLHTSRLRGRGYDQSKLLARHIGHALMIPVNSDAIVRIRHTKKQTDVKDPKARKQNVRGAFAASPQAVNGKQIVLIDDVLTTGATLIECAGALYGAGARNVVALTLARA